MTVFGLSFGVLATEAGFSVGKAAGLSLLVFAGGAQFAAVGVVDAGGAAASAVAAGLLLNARFLAWGSPPRRTSGGAGGPSSARSS